MPLTHQQSEALIVFTLLKKAKVAEVAESSKIEQGFSCAVLNSRLEACVPQLEWEAWRQATLPFPVLAKAGEPVDVGKQLHPDATAKPPMRKRPNVAQVVRIFCSMLCDRPGTAVMWAYTLAVLAQEKKGEEVTMSDWCDAFPMGIPSAQACQDAWEYQKVHNRVSNIDVMKRPASDNCLDYQEFWPKLAAVL